MDMQPIPPKKSVNGRNKGASFERAIAHELEAMTGVRFVRNLEQTRAIDQSDLIPDDDAWPFALELKNYKEGNGCRPAWKAQAVKAAILLQRIPCVIFKYNRMPIRCAVPFAAFGAAFDFVPEATDEWAEVSLEGLAYLAREIMTGDDDE